jgi:hypothetical protein
VSSPRFSALLLRNPNRSSYVLSTIISPQLAEFHYGVVGPLEATPFIISSRLALNSDPAFHSGYLSPCATRYPIIVSNCASSTSREVPVRFNLVGNSVVVLVCVFVALLFAERRLFPFEVNPGISVERRNSLFRKIRTPSLIPDSDSPSAAVQWQLHAASRLRCCCRRPRRQTCAKSRGR